MLEKEITYYLSRKDEFVNDHFGKFVLIKGDKLIGVFNSHTEALSEAARKFGLDSYLIKQILVNDEDIEVPALTLGLLQNADITSTNNG